MILAIVGPTGVGKTKLSIELAKKYNAIMLNCDAMQVYDSLNIGTAKVKEEEKEGIPHFLFDIAPVTQNYTVFDYQKDVRKLLDKYYDRNIIFVGGTGLYLKAALYDYHFEEENNYFDYSNFSNEQLYKECLIKDPNCSIHMNNRRRLIRFLMRKNYSDEAPKSLYDAIIIGLTTERENLYSIINQRVDQMVLDGLENEVKAFYDNHIESKALKTAIGYKEFYEYFGQLISYEECIDKIKKNSRHYAKRQYTFFRHQLPVEWFSVNYADFNETIDKVINYIENKNY